MYICTTGAAGACQAFHPRAADATNASNSSSCSASAPSTPTYDQIPRPVRERGMDIGVDMPQAKSLVNIDTTDDSVATTHTLRATHTVHTCQIRNACLYFPIFRPRIPGRPGGRPASATPEPRAQSPESRAPKPRSRGKIGGCACTLVKRRPRSLLAPSNTTTVARATHSSSPPHNHPQRAHGRLVRSVGILLRFTSLSGGYRFLV